MDLCLRVAQIPRSRDLAIFVLANGQIDRENQLFYPCCACAWSNKTKGTAVCNVASISAICICNQCLCGLEMLSNEKLRVQLG